MQLRMYARMLQRGWWIIAISALAALLLALIINFQATPQYQASARSIIAPNPALSEQGGVIVNSLQTLDRRSIAETFAAVLDSSTINQEASRALNLPPEVVEQYRFSAVVLPGANVLELTVIGPNPETAALLANTMNQKGIEYVTSLYTVYSVSVLDQALPPPDPISPQPRRDAPLALVLGALAGCGLAILREQLRTPLSALRERTAVEPLSNASSRSHVLSQVNQLARNGNAPVAVGLVQFDGLNDLLTTLPPAASQQLLRRITATFRDNLRGRDLVGRWNDTTYVVALPQVSAEAALDPINSISQSMAFLAPAEGEEQLALQPRVALIEYNAGDAPETLVERAEAALEKARLNGKRNMATKMQTVSA